MRNIFPVVELGPNLRELAQKFEQCIEMKLFLPIAYQKRLLRMEEMEKIKKEENRGIQVVYLLDMLERKGPESVRKMMSCFEAEKEHMGHAELAKDLKRGI